MSLSREYQEYHLTQNGWIDGSFHGDSLGGSIDVEIPKDRVLTIRCYDEQTSVYSKTNFYEQEVWSCDDKELINQLKIKYGKPNWFGYERMK